MVVAIKVLKPVLTISLLVLVSLAQIPFGSAGGFDEPMDTTEAPLPPIGPTDPVRLVVGYTEALPEAAERLIVTHGGEVVRVDATLDFAVVTAPQAGAEALMRYLPLVPGITYAKEDGQMRALFTPDDPGYGQQWGPAAIGMEAAWDVARGDHTIEVAVLDTGVDYAHSDLAANVCRLGPDFHNGDDDPDDDHYHGTHVAGTVAAKIDNGVGVAGMADACIVPVKVLSSGGFGYWSDLASAIQWSADNGTEIISMSLGGCCDPGEPLVSAVQNADAAGVLIIAAAGNSYCSPVGYPAAYPEIVAVGSLDDPGDEVSSFSSCGPEVEVSAPGRDVYSTMPDNGYGSLSGTSMATPHTSGVAALFWSEFPALTSDEVRCILAQNADDLLAPGPDEESGFGRIDAAAMLANPACVPKPPSAPIVVGVSGDGSAALGWNKPHSWGGIDGYRVFRGSDDLVLIADVNTTTYEDHSAASGNTYTYRVQAYNDAGNGTMSDPVTVAVRDAVTLPFATDFESGLGDWQASGAWHVTSDRAGAGSNSAYFGRENGPGLDDNDYPDDVYGTLHSPPIRIPENVSAHAAFWQYSQLEMWFYEHPVIEVATTDDPFSFEPVWEMGGLDIYEGDGALDLTPYAGQVVYFRYVVDADFCCGGEGWYVDEIVVAEGAPPAIPPVTHLHWPVEGAFTGGSGDIAATYMDGNGDHDVVSADYRIDGGDWTEATLHGHYMFASYTGLTTGNHTLTVRATDSTGLNATQTVTIRVDGAAPTLDVAAPAEGGSVSCIARFHGTATDTGGAGLGAIYAFRPDLEMDAAHHQAIWYFDGEDTASWWLNITTAYIDEGAFNVTLHVVDQAGNRNSVTYPLVRDDDLCLPEIELVNPTEGAVLDGLETIEGTVAWPTDNATGDVIFHLDGRLLHVVHGMGSGGFSFDWNTWQVENGTHTLRAYAVEEQSGLANLLEVTFSVTNERTPRVDAVAGSGRVACSVAGMWFSTADACGGDPESLFQVEPGLTGIRIVLTWDQEHELDRLFAKVHVGTHTFESVPDGPGRAVIDVTAVEGLLSAGYDTARIDVRAQMRDLAPAVAVDEGFSFSGGLAYWGASLD